MINKKRGIRIILVVGILSFSIAGLYLICNVRNTTYKRMKDIIQFFPSKNASGHLYGLTSNGKIYCYYKNKNKVDVIIEESDIIFLEMGMQSLIIHKDGSIYIDEAGGFEGELIGTIEGAVSGDTISTHTAIITDKGQLYMYGYNDAKRYNLLGTGDTQRLDKFTLIELPDKIVKVDYGSTYTFLLTDNNKIYRTGYLGNLNYTTFCEYEQWKAFVDIQSSHTSVFALGTHGKIIMMDNSYDIFFPSLSEKLDMVNNIKDFTVASQNVLGVSSDGELYYWGRDLYKPDEENSINPQKIKNIGIIEEVYSTGGSVYAIKADEIICIPLDRENRLIKFINKYNIFRPHYK